VEIDKMYLYNFFELKIYLIVGTIGLIAFSFLSCDDGERQACAMAKCLTTPKLEQEKIEFIKKMRNNTK